MKPEDFDFPMSADQRRATFRSRSERRPNTARVERARALAEVRAANECDEPVGDWRPHIFGEEHR